VLPLIYLVDDDREASSLLSRTLKDNHYDVLAFPASAGVIAAAEEKLPALFLVNALMLVGSGLSLCRAVRQSPALAQTPVMLISGRSSEDDRILALDLGADDFLTRPFGPRELLARINALLRRSVHRGGRPRIQAGEIEVDTERFVLTVRGQDIEATATQVRLVEYLMRNEGRVFSRDQILDAVWSDARFVTPRTIDVHIRRLRQMIELDPANPTYLQTVRGAGYSFTAQNRGRQSKANATQAWLPSALAQRLDAFCATIPASDRSAS
jgi:DNA-binding response OmpR family regulator